MWRDDSSHYTRTTEDGQTVDCYRTSYADNGKCDRDLCTATVGKGMVASVRNGGFYHLECAPK